MKCIVLNFNGTTHRDDALVGHDTVIVVYFNNKTIA